MNGPTADPYSAYLADLASTLERIKREAEKDTKTAARAIMFLGYTFAPWLRASIPVLGVKVSDFVNAMAGWMIGRHAAKDVAYEMERMSNQLSRDTVFVQTTPRETKVVAGALPVGTTVPLSYTTEEIKIGPYRIAMPLLMRVELPPEPWRFQNKDEYMARVYKPRAATLESISPCGTHYVETAPGVFSKRAIPC